MTVLCSPTIQPKPDPQEQKPPTFLFLPINLSNSTTTIQRSQSAPPQQNLNLAHRQCSTPRLLSRPALRPEEAKHRQARRQLSGNAAVDECLIGPPNQTRQHLSLENRQNDNEEISKRLERLNNFLQPSRSGQHYRANMTRRSLPHRPGAPSRKPAPIGTCSTPVHARSRRTDARVKRGHDSGTNEKAAGSMRSTCPAPHQVA